MGPLSFLPPADAPERALVVAWGRRGPRSKGGGGVGGVFLKTLGSGSI